MGESSSICEISIPSAVRGYNIYKDVWDPFVDDMFITKHEGSNSHNKYTIHVAVFADDTCMKMKKVVGHLPREVLKILYLFVCHGGEGQLLEK